MKNTKNYGQHEDTEKERAFPPPGLHIVSGGRGGSFILNELKMAYPAATGGDNQPQDVCKQDTVNT